MQGRRPSRSRPPHLPRLQKRTVTHDRSATGLPHYSRARGHCPDGRVRDGQDQIKAYRSRMSSAATPGRPSFCRMQLDPGKRRSGEDKVAKTIVEVGEVAIPASSSAPFVAQRQRSAASTGPFDSSLLDTRPPNDPLAEVRFRGEVVVGHASPVWGTTCPTVS